MNFDGYFSILPENDEFPNVQPWIPEIPEKSRTITPTIDSVDLGTFYDYAPTESNSMICHITGGNSYDCPPKKDSLNNIPGMCVMGFTDLLTEGVAESKRNICMTDEASVPSLYSFVDNCSHFSSSLGSLLSNGDLCSSTVPPSGVGGCPLVSAMLPYNKNATAHTESYTTSSLTNSSNFSVSKTDQMKRLENKKLQEVLSLIFEDPVQDEEHVSSLKIQDVEKQCNALLYSCIHPPSVALSSFPKENQALNNVGDLNDTPLKKPPKRRKHRPKVVIEGKPRKEFKSEAKKAENSKEKRVGKRKYVRKSFHNGADKITESKIRSCRRVIHFGTENPKDGRIIKVTDQRQCFKELGSPVLKLASSIQADDEQAEPFPTGWIQTCYSPFTDINSLPEGKMDAQISHHSCSAITENGEAYFRISPRSQIPIPEVIELNSKQVSYKVHQNQQTDVSRDTGFGYLGTTNVKNIGNFNFIGKVVGQAQNSLKNNVNSTIPLLESCSKSVETSGAHRNQKKDSKRDHASVASKQIYSHTHTSSSSPCQIRNHGSYVDDLDTHGKKKQKVASDGMESSNTHISSAENHYEHGGGNSMPYDGFLSQANTIKLAHSSESDHVQNKGSNVINESIRKWLLKSASSNFYRGGGQCFYSDPNPYMRKTETKMSNMLTLFPDMVMTGEEMNSLQSMDATSSPTHCVTSLDIKHRTVLAKRRTMEQSKETVQHPVNSSDNSLMKTFCDAEAFGRFPNNIHHDRRVPGNGLSAKWKQMDQIEEIEYKFRLLTINDNSGRDLLCLQNAIVPYKVDGKIVSYKVGGKIVPYEGIYPIKKRKPRPKVDLDPETDRLWKLLMVKNCEEAAGADVDKERYWEEEREVFRGRADSFIARMHLVQGDRRFSQWKGSVVDSVIGVFLTQNVSDHLSSSAFMSLAAQFPLKSMKSMSYYKDDSDLPPEPEVIDFVEPLCNYNGITDSVSQNDQQELTLLGVRWYLPSPEKIAEEIISSRDYLDTLSAKAVEASRSSSGSNSGVSNSEVDDSAVAHKANPIHDYLGHWTLNVTEESDCEINRSPFYHSPPLHSHLHEDTENWQHIILQGEETEKILAEIASPPSSTDTVIQLPSSPKNYTLNFIPNTEVHHLEENFTSWPSVIHRKVIKDDTIEGSHLECGQETHLKDPQPEVKARVHDYLLSSSVYQLWSNNFQQTRGALCMPGMSTTEKSYHIEGYTENLNNPLYHFMYPSAVIGERENEICGSSVEVNNKNNDAVTEFDNKIMENNLKTGAYSSDKMSARKGKKEKYGNSVCDWQQFRKEVQSISGKRGRNIDTMDSLDYEAIRNADVDVVSATIRERGMNNMLAERIKGFLDRIVAEHGNIDLEWLRDAPPDKAKDYLLSIRGLGLKSVECVRLLTLHHLAFPVDTNVGRIAVRLGWVPLQPLPESLQLHLLELYPVLESIQKYLWPRLCKLDQRTLYELHYQMITFGKVFCTKSRPNCNACPMRGECRHFASAFASARLSLPGPEDRSIISMPIPITDTRNPIFSNLMPLPSVEQEGSRVTVSKVVNCDPIIEEPETPEPDVQEITEADIEDTFCEDPEEIPIIRLNVKEFTTNLQSYIQENNIDFNEGGMSKALVALDPTSASIPAPKLKNVSRLRTEHQVYELPDSHPLLLEMDRREPDDPSPYLLAIWTPGETADTIQESEISCGHLESSATCTEDACISCSSIREANSRTVRGTLLIPCRTATRGSFPLNGTYFQVNEMFADHDSSLNPIMVPRTWIWNLPRRTVYFGTSVSTIFKGLSTEGIQYCFWRGFVCVRGFDKNTRAPRPLIARLHFPASKLQKMKIVKK